MKSERGRYERSGSVHEPSGGLALFENDAAYLEWLARNPDGYVVNVRRTFSPNYVVLHRATCTHVSMLRESGAYTERGYRKFCGATYPDAQEAPTRCGRGTDSFTTRCSHCRP